MTEPTDPNQYYAPQSAYSPQPGYSPQPSYAPQHLTTPFNSYAPYSPVPLTAPPGHEHRGRARNVLAGICAVVVALTLGAGAVYFVSKDSDTDTIGAPVANPAVAHNVPDTSQSSIALPMTFGTFSRIDGPLAKSIVSTMRSRASGVSEAADLLDESSIGVYSENTGDIPSLIVMTLPSSRIPFGPALSADQMTGAFLSQAVTPDDVLDLDAGTHGGSAKCGYANHDTTHHETMCAWSDPRTTGLLVSIGNPTPQALNAVGQSFRDKVE